MTDAPPLGVYVHWPYCAKICPYCDFNVVRDRGRTDEQAALADAIVADLTAQRALTGPRQLLSIFFGGGTPSLMDPAQAGSISEGVPPPRNSEVRVRGPVSAACADRSSSMAATRSACSAWPRSRRTLKSQ